MNDFLYFLVLILALPYLAVPIMIRRNHSFALQPKVRLMLEGFLPRAPTDYFEKIGSDLGLFGFEHKIDAISLDYGPNLRVFLRLFISKKYKSVAIAASLMPDHEDEPLKNFLEYSSQFSDGFELSTHNSDIVGAPLEHKQKKVCSMPSICDPQKLFKVHMFLLKKFGYRSDAAVVPAEGQEFESLVKSFKKDIARQESLGALMLDKEAQCFRPTWAGAFLMAWYSMWPISLLRSAISRLKIRFLFRDLEQTNA